MKFLQKVKEIRSKTGELHFQRYAIIETEWFALYVHRIHKEDQDKHLHSHPWNFLSMVLYGGYHELREDGRYKPKKPGTISWMSRNGFHKIAHIDRGPVTTLFFTFGPHQPWYYLVNGAEVESVEYRNLKNSGGLP